jgi:tetratricopeptide (TPR) repeat protein
MRVIHLIKGVVQVALACLVIPLLIPAFRRSLIHSWNYIGYGPKPTSLYLNKIQSNGNPLPSLSSLPGTDPNPASPVKLGTSDSSLQPHPVQTLSNPGAMVFIQEADKLKKQGRFFEASIHYKNALKMNPEVASIRIKYAKCLAKYETQFERKKLFQEGLQYSSFAEVLLNYEVFGINAFEVEPYFRRALTQNPAVIDLRIGYAKLLI